MNYWERKEKFSEGWHKAPKLTKSEFLYRDGNGVEYPITFEEGLTIEYTHAGLQLSKVLVKPTKTEKEKKLSYKEMLKEIDAICEENAINGNEIKTMLGIPLEDYKTKDLYNVMKKFLEENK